MSWPAAQYRIAPRYTLRSKYPCRIATADRNAQTAPENASTTGTCQRAWRTTRLVPPLPRSVRCPTVAIGYVRPARPDEAGEVARIQLTTWQVAYRRLIPRDVLDELDPEWLAGRWREAIESPPSPRHRVLIAIEQAES